ncbi:agamous-like MADS-box protein AGL61 [Forsythia ovata]|uniref:Agamous-like MADS-box protein AGL61 n=1 Tax=Forsythia ovata TaxID=205694 RepID=A0ABD1R4U7_9LAMI
MGTGTRTGKKKIEIKKITKQSSKMVTFSKRRKGLFKKAQELQSKTGTSIALIVFSPANRPYTHGDLSLIDAVGGSSAAGTAMSGGGCDAGAVGNAIPTRSLMLELEKIDVELEGCRNLNELVYLEKQLKDLREEAILQGLHMSLNHPPFYN